MATSAPPPRSASRPSSCRALPGRALRGAIDPEALRAGTRGAVTERIVEAPEVLARSEGRILEEDDATVRGVEEELGRRLAEGLPQDESDFGVRRGQEKRGRA